MFRFEKDLVQTFIEHFEEKKIDLQIQVYTSEFNYTNGKTDIIAQTESHDIIAFEAKLKNWKKAINQAYRNTSFADFSYVVLPASMEYIINKAEQEFIKRNIGLILVDEEKAWVALGAKLNIPILPWLQEKARTEISIAY